MSVKVQLSRAAKNPDDKTSLERAVSVLEEGLKAIQMRKKHIKIVDRSLATVPQYQSDPLTSDSGNKKDLNRAEKDARKEVEKRSENTGKR